ncbi:bestrophin family protein [Acidovorax sp. Be4]|uniref:Bestrophin family protein n=1 Tax=Acidovorax bellezanensis TaxID=2976702 RepID=A0ABT2PH99_9BURK|nr:bestrophin family protein [Acidovorax sp. Be4]MCT9809508.1 bestrophin family protein [Acidovorax sp. Be4]
MIVRERPAGFRLFLVLRGSVLQRIRLSLAINTLLAILVTLAHGNLFSVKITLTPIPFTLIGLPLAIFLGFRNNTAYDRYWEGRKLWGELVIQARTLARQCLGMIHLPLPVDSTQRESDVRVRMIHRTIAYAHALRLQLRDQSDSADVQRWVTAQEWEVLRHKPASKRADALMMTMGQELGDCVRRGEIDPCLATRFDTTLTEMLGAAASCERIRHTPMPFSYALLLHRTAYMYCFLLPFGLVDITGFMTPFVVAIVAYTFFGLDALGDELEEPFGLESNDLPLDTICRGIEISLLESLNDPNVPEPLKPVNYQLT